MAGPFDFTSPGAAFSDALTNALVERRAQERQNLLDSISIRAQQRADQEADQRKQYQDYEMQMGRDRNDRERAAFIAKSLPVNTDISKLQPEDQQLLRKFGMTNQQVTPYSPPIMGEDIPTSGGPGAALSTPNKPEQRAQTTEVFSGDDAQQQDERIKQATTQMIASSSPMVRASLMQMQALYGGHLPPQALPYLEPARHIKAYDPETHQVTDTGAIANPWDIVENKGFRPAAPPKDREIPYAYHKGDDGQYYPVFRDAHGKDIIGTTSVVPQGVVVNESKNSPVKFAEGASNNHRTLVTGFLTSPTAKTGQYLQQSALNLVRTSNASDNAKSLAIRFISAKDQNEANAALATANNDPSFTAKDKEQFDALIEESWPKQLSAEYHNVVTPAAGGGFWHDFFGSSETPR